MATTILQYQLSNGSWINCDGRSNEFQARAVAHATKIGAEKISTLSPTWQRQLALTASEATDRLSAGAHLIHGDEWYDRIRYAPAPRPVVEPTRHRFTCPRCGEHRDTTLSGHCDDCEA